MDHLKYTGSFSSFLRITALIVLTASWCGEFVLGQQWVNVRSYGTTNIGDANLVIRDDDDNLYVTGHFTYPVTIGTTTFTSQGNVDISLTKYAPDGQVIWTRQYGGVGQDRVSDIVLYNGQIYITGLYFGDSDLDGHPLICSGFADTYVARLDEDGNVIWVTTGGEANTYTDTGGLTVDNSGNVYICGNFQHGITFGPLTAMNSNGWSYTDGYIAKFDLNGNPVWIEVLGGPQNGFAYSISSYNNRIYVTGDFLQTIVLDQFTIFSSGNSDVFLAEINPDGQFQWAHSYGGSSDETGMDILADTDGSVYLGGSFIGPVDFGGQLLNSGNSAADAYLAKYTDSGNLVWAKKGGSLNPTTWDVINRIYADPNHAIYVTGEFGGTANFGGLQLSATGETDIFVARYDQSGQATWVKQGGGADFERGTGICALQDGRVFMTGYMMYDGQFDCIHIEDEEFGLQQLLGEIDFTDSLNLLLGNDTLLCQGQSITFDVSNPGAQYLWQDGSTDPVFITDQPGTYWVEIQSTGCSFSDTIEVTASESGSLTLSTGDTTLCSSSSLVIDLSGSFSTFLWQDGSTDPVYTITESGNYSVTRTNSCGTQNSDTIEVTIIDPQVELGNDTTICENELLNLSAQFPQATYLWQDGSTDPEYTVSETGTYWVTLVVSGCSATDTILVSYTPLPSVALGNDTVLCQGAQLLLSATSLPGTSYVWSDNSTLPALTISSAGYYSVTASNTCGATSDTIGISYSSFEDIYLGADTTICSGDTVILDATSPFAFYTWQDNSTASAFMVTSPGNYWVSSTSEGCEQRDTITIGFFDLPFFDLGEDTTICNGEELYLLLTHPQSFYTWENGSTEPDATISEEGTYWVTETNQCGFFTDTLEVAYEECACTIYFPNSFTPQQDEINELFGPEYYCGIEQYVLHIYNRWGEVVFRTTDISSGWDGNYNGAKIPDGVYAYDCFYQTAGIFTQLTGHVTVIR